MVGLSKTERKQLIEIIKKTCEKEVKSRDEILKQTLIEGYSQFTVLSTINTLTIAGYLKSTVLRESDGYSDALIGYKWVG